MFIVYVVLTTTFLVVLVGSFQASVNTQLALTEKMVAEAKAEALVEGGVQLTIAEIAARRPQDVRQGKRPVDLPTGRVEVGIRDLGGLIDLNYATPALLSNLFLAAGADGNAAEQFASQIVAQRAAQPYISAEQIGRLPGMSSALLRRLLPAITVHSGSRIVDPASGSRLVLTALAGGNVAMVKSYIERLARGGRLTSLQVADAGPVIGSGFEVQAEIRLPGDRRLSRHAIVKPAPFAEMSSSLIIVEWRAGEDGL